MILTAQWLNERYGPNIQTLRDLVIDNSINSIEANAFENLYLLEKLTFKNFNLSIIERDTFVGLSSLKSLKLATPNSENTIILKEGAFDGLNKLEKLEFNPILFDPIFFENIKISSIEVGAFGGLKNLIRLDLDKSILTNLRAGHFAGLVNLHELRLIDNQIERIDPGAFYGLDNLRQLFLSNNKITKIEPGTFDNLTNLSFLGLSNNQLVRINQGIFNQLRLLTVLHLSENKIVKIDPGTFGGLNRLEDLFLKKNQIVKIESGTFDDLNRLKNLDLRQNYLINNHNIPSVRFSNFEKSLGTQIDYQYNLDELFKSFFDRPINLYDILTNVSNLKIIADNFSGDISRIKDLGSNKSDPMLERIYLLVMYYNTKRQQGETDEQIGASIENLWYQDLKLISFLIEKNSKIYKQKYLKYKHKYLNAKRLIF